MPVEIRIPTPLRRHTAERPQVEVPAAGAVGEALDFLFGQFPALRNQLVGEGGKVRSFVNLYVNGEDIRFLEGVATTLRDGDEISIVPAIAGGCR